MIEKLILRIVNQMETESILEPEEKDEYIYAYTTFCEEILTLGTVCILGVILNNVPNTLLFLSFFLSLRKRTGGFHADIFLNAILKLYLYMYAYIYVEDCLFNISVSYYLC